MLNLGSFGFMKCHTCIFIDALAQLLDNLSSHFHEQSMFGCSTSCKCPPCSTHRCRSLLFSFVLSTRPYGLYKYLHNSSSLAAGTINMAASSRSFHFVPFIIFSRVKMHFSFGPDYFQAVLQTHGLKLVDPDSIVVRPMRKRCWIHYTHLVASS